MSNFNDPYIITTLLSTVTILIMAVLLLGLKIPSDTRLNNYRISCRLLAAAYIILAAAGLWEITDKTSLNNKAVMFSITLIAASFQAFLFTFSLITLINIRYMTVFRMACNLIPIGMVSVILLLFMDDAENSGFNGISCFSLFCYGFQLGYYVVLFSREYRKYENQMDNFFSEDEQRRLNWILIAFYMALGIGVFAILSLFVPLGIYVIFILVYTLFYVYYTMKYINYIHSFYRIIPALELPVGINTKETKLPVSADLETKKSLDNVIDLWIERKGFLASGITLDMLAIEFMTNRSYLSAHINKKNNRNFKTWIGELRIEEAKRLMILYPKKTLSEIGEMVGISERVSFYRQFLKITGKSPNDFRTQNLN